MTQSMLNLNKEVEGLFCSDLIFTNNLIPQLNINIMIVNTQGTLILSNYKNDIVSNSSLLINFYDEEITGFTTDDWISILNYYYTKQTNSTCNYEYFQIPCRFNSIYNKEFVIQIIKLQNIDYFLILFYDIQIEQEIEFNIKHLLHIIHQNLNKNILVTILASIGIILLQIIIIYIIFLPMYKVIRQSLFFLKKQQKKSNQCRPQNLLQKTNLFQDILINKIRPNQNCQESNNALMQFKLRFNTLFDTVLAQRMTINPQCQIIQQFKYPQKVVYNYYEQQSASPKVTFQKAALILMLHYEYKKQLLFFILKDVYFLICISGRYEHSIIKEFKIGSSFFQKLIQLRLKVYIQLKQLTYFFSQYYFFYQNCYL
ncbi:unnamed protein product [Paramecium octaurelia]|uniref:Transmembrane protein n=1 Tax=Paramecium octaurelia TaxID=43137 RepID=A0A8S1XU77_PAROT|nr:unnamed protein product [Paramecium octaurelia]